MTFAAGSRFIGGEGGGGLDYPWATAGLGGDGIRATLTAQIRLMDNYYKGGDGGYLLPGQTGQSGLPTNWAGGALVERPGVARRLLTPTAVVGDGELWHLRASGTPGDVVHVALSKRPGFLFDRHPLGIWQVAYPARFPIEPAGIIPASGVLDFYNLAPPLQAGRAGQVLYVQALILDAQGINVLSNVATVLMIDADGLSDCDGSSRSDLLEIVEGSGADCNDDLQIDSCMAGTDCNLNGLADTIDLACGTSLDGNRNGIPDECETAFSYVDDGAPAGGDGSQAFPFQNLTEALAAAGNGWEIRMLDGVYMGPQNRDLYLGGLQLKIKGLGGASHCIIDCQGLGTAFSQAAGDPLVELEGLSIRNGYTSSNGGGAQFLGEARLTNCVFRLCVANDYGGAIYGDSVELRDCSFVYNSANWGGALFTESGLTVSGCNFDHNAAAGGGGACYSRINDSTDAVFSHCVFRANTADFGAAIYADPEWNSNGTLRLVLDNSFLALGRARAGGAVYTDNPANSPFEFHCTSSTLVKNVASDQIGSIHGGGAFFLRGLVDVELHNSVLWLNAAAVGPQMVLEPFSSDLPDLTVTYCDVEGGLASIHAGASTVIWGAGNLALDPLFENPLSGDYRLGPGSPCIDAGDNGKLAAEHLDIDGDGDMLEPVPLDLLNISRRIDDPNAVDTGAGSAPVTDMGALER
jgi:hypothetical protein